MKVLVAFASKHHATEGIAEAIGATFNQEGMEAHVLDVTAGPPIDNYDAFVIGTAVYAGHALHAAEEFLRDNAAELLQKPVWLFSSGPLSETPTAKDEASQILGLAKLVGARDHQVFSGKLDKADLNFVERAIFSLVRAKEGDYRDWQQVIAWAEAIAAQLKASVGPKS